MPKYEDESCCYAQLEEKELEISPKKRHGDFQTNFILPKGTTIVQRNSVKLVMESRGGKSSYRCNETASSNLLQPNVYDLSSSSRH